MTDIEAYLGEVHRRLAGMDPKVQRDILRELRSHLGDSVAANGGNEGAAIAGLGDPVAVARRYRELYGYGVSYRAVFSFIAGVLGFFTVPVLFAGNEGIFPYFFSAVFLSIEFLFLIWVSVSAGNRAGLGTGVVGLSGRFAGFGVALGLNAGSSLVTWDGLALFLVVSGLIVLVGWVPGRAKQAWQRPGMEL